MSIIVGAHPQNLSLSILARRTDYADALRAQGLEFFVYGNGAQTIPLVKLGVLDLAGTGATPPILAKADGLQVAVFGVSGPRHENGGLLVRANAGIHSLHDLKGRNIALMPISWHTQFLAAELHAAGLHWNDVNAVDLLPATAKDAFEAGLLDAIVATDPLYSQIRNKVDITVLARPGEAFSNRSVYWARHETLQQHPHAVTALLHALQASDRETAADLPGAARLLDGLNGNTAAQWLQALQARPWGVHEPDAAFLNEQQAHADIFTSFGLIRKSLDMQDTVTSQFIKTAESLAA